MENRKKVISTDSDLLKLASKLVYVLKYHKDSTILPSQVKATQITVFNLGNQYSLDILYHLDVLRNDGGDLKGLRVPLNDIAELVGKLLFIENDKEEDESDKKRTLFQQIKFCIRTGFVKINNLEDLKDVLTIKDFLEIYTEKPEETLDKTIKPEYYNKGKEDLISFLKDHDSQEEFKGFMVGNAMKYLTRLGKKDDELQDLDKAIEYLKRYRKYLTDKQEHDKLKKLNTHI